EAATLDSRLDLLIGVLASLDTEEKLEFITMMTRFVNTVELALQNMATGLRGLMLQMQVSTESIGKWTAALRDGGVSFEEMGDRFRTGFDATIKGDEEEVTPPVSHEIAKEDA